MFENLKKKLKGFLSKASEKLEVEEEPVKEPVIEKALPKAPKPKPAKAEPKPEPETVKAEVIEAPPPTPHAKSDMSKSDDSDKSLIAQPPAPKVEPVVEPVPVEKLKPRFKLFRRKPKEERKAPEPPKKEEIPEKPKRLKLISKLTKKQLSEKDLDPILWDLEIALLENDVAKEVTEAITEETKKALLGAESGRKDVQSIISDSIKKSIESILEQEKPDIFKLIDSKQEKPFVILFFGFNGTGKTLTIGRFAKLLKDKGYSVVLAAADTFRAAAIEQLEVHAKAVGVPIIKQKKGADPAAVIYDAIEHAKSKGIDIVLGDTAGRSHTNINLMDELKKVVRVNKPDLKIFVGDSLTGNDAADQAREFDQAVGIDCSVLNKVDCDAKGGATLSVTFVTKKPIIYLGTGQGYGDMIEFDPEWFVGKIF